MLRTTTLVIVCALAGEVLPSALSPRIISGTQAQKGQFPWQAAVYIREESGTSFCGGSLISSQWVLTAAHCTEGALEIVVRLGIVLLLDSSTLVSIPASKVVPNPTYSADDFVNDIALIQLSEPVAFNDYIQPIKLPTSALADGTTITVSGWGKTDDAMVSVSPALNYVNLVTISNNECAFVWGLVSLTGSIVCAHGTSTENICLGDSGGPLVTGSGSDAELVAIVSFTLAKSCALGVPSGHTRVAPYKRWILSITGDI